MPQTVTNTASGKKATTIVFDMKEEEKKREQHLKILEISKKLREDGNKNLYRTVQAILDPVSVKLFKLNVNKDTDKAVCEVCFPNVEIEKLTDDYCNRIIKQTTVEMMQKGYKIINSKLFRDPNDPEKVIGKILVSVPVTLTK